MQFVFFFIPFNFLCLFHCAKGRRNLGGTGLRVLLQGASQGINCGREDNVFFPGSTCDFLRKALGWINLWGSDHLASCKNLKSCNHRHFWFSVWLSLTLAWVEWKEAYGLRSALYLMALDLFPIRSIKAVAGLLSCKCIIGGANLKIFPVGYQACIISCLSTPFDALPLLWQLI